jgi:hypothetical protein
MPPATVGESTAPPVLYLHRVWFVFGAVELELPECVRSWWNIGHVSAVGCALENPESPEEILIGKTETKNSTIKAKHTIAFLFIFSLLSSTLAPKIRLMVNQDAC